MTANGGAVEVGAAGHLTLVIGAGCSVFANRRELERSDGVYRLIAGLRLDACHQDALEQERYAGCILQDPDRDGLGRREPPLARSGTLEALGAIVRSRGRRRGRVIKDKLLDHQELNISRAPFSRLRTT